MLVTPDHSTECSMSCKEVIHAHVNKDLKKKLTILVNLKTTFFPLIRSDTIENKIRYLIILKTNKTVFK